MLGFERQEKHTILDFESVATDKLQSLGIWLLDFAFSFRSTIVPQDACGAADRTQFVARRASYPFNCLYAFSESVLRLVAFVSKPILMQSFSI